MLKALDALDSRLQKPPLIDLLNTSERLHSFLYMNAVLECVLPARRLTEARQALFRV
jgi:hypothetical protein